ncbi:MAG: TetR/AcrR family transcriptional regulator [Desulfobacterales bacterium]|nr:TetR/AcrR family transcriptional regulator [Desulfobacterales bacterium]
MKRARSRESKQERLNDILYAAKTVFVKKRYENATIREIARRARVTPATIYLYFKNKDELFGTILEDVQVNLNQVLVNASETPGSIFDRFFTILKAYFEYTLHEEEPYLLEVRIADLEISPVLRRRLEHNHLKTYKIIISVAKEGIEQGILLPEIDAPSVAYSLIGIVDGLYYADKDGDFALYNLGTDDVLRNFLTYLYNGIACEPIKI